MKLVIILVSLISLSTSAQFTAPAENTVTIKVDATSTLYDCNQNKAHMIKSLKEANRVVLVEGYCKIVGSTVVSEIIILK